MSVRRPLLILVVALAGCGGAEPQPRDVLQRLVSGRGGASRCSEVFSDRFVREVYGSAARCRAQEAKGGGQEFRHAHAQTPHVNGDRGFARIAFPDGGAVVGIVREDGEWKVDHYDDILVRAIVAPLLVRQIELTASEPGLNVAGAKECVYDWIDRMGPVRLRRVVYGALANDRRAAAPLDAVIPKCLADARSGPGGQSYLRLYLVRDVVSEARKHGYGGDAIACIRRHMRSLTDQEVLEHVTRDKSAPPPATRHIAAIVGRCG